MNKPLSKEAQIEHLRHERDTLQIAMNNLNIDVAVWKKEAQEFEKENKRLREALKDMVMIWENDRDEDEYEDWEEWVEAQQALKGQNND